jgi:hypothetical protein
MNPFEGKSPSERNKIIAAAVLGVLALGALFFTFGRGLFSSGTKATASVSPTPKPAASASPANPESFKLPSAAEQNFTWMTIPVVYNPAVHSAPDPGRNIFAFYEPPPLCPSCPTPVKPVIVETPKPTPTPFYDPVNFNPTSVFAGSRSFRIEVNGTKFEPDAKIYFSQQELPTQFLSPQRLVADVPASMITSEGPRQIIIQSTDGKRYSSQTILNVQAPPKPNFQYIGMVARKRFNNDTAYLMMPGSQMPISARLNDVIGGRFKLVSISAKETVFEDVSLGFRHQVPLYVPAPGTATTTGPNRGFPGGENYNPYNPNAPQQYQVPPGQSIPGIPDNIPRYVPPQPANRAVPDKKSDDDDDDTDGNH